MPPKRRPALILSMITIVALLFWFGCADSGGNDGDDASTTTVSITLLAGFAQEPASGSIMRNARGTVNDVVSVKVRVERSSDSAEIVAETDMTETSPGVWEITLNDLPIDVSLDFTADAYDSIPQAIFTDTVTATLTDGGNNDITFEMESIDDGVEPDNPRIVSATIPDEIERDSTGNIIAFTISHTGVVEYVVEVTNGTITSATSGTHDPVTDLEVTYSAPSTPGTDTITLKVNDPNLTDVVGAVYNINVVDILVSSSISVVFGPAATGMHFLRSASTLQLEVQTDPTTDLTYSWSGTGSFTALSGSANPVVINPFSDTDTGTITSTVTDGNAIQAFLTRTVEAGDFPYTVNRPITGVLDTSFGIGGVAIHNNAAGGDGADDGWGIATDANGKIIVAGSSTNSSLNRDMVIWRYTTDGSPDTTFSSDGYATHNNAAGGNGDDNGREVAVDSSGKILVVGTSYNGTQHAYDTDMALWRYNTDGSLDTTFSSDGWVTDDQGAGSGTYNNDSGFGLTLASDGKILATGGSNYSETIVWRYNTDGSLDTDFDSDGRAVVALGADLDNGQVITTDSNGKILVGGQVKISSLYDSTLLRFNADGSLDASFDSNGYVIMSAGTGHDSVWAVAVDSNGRIVISGRSVDASDGEDMYIARYTDSGSLDTTFGSTGIVTYSSGNGDDGSFSLAIDNNGRLLVAGYLSNSDKDLAVWRYNTDGSLDTTFGSSGVFVYDGGYGDDAAKDMSIDSEGRILLTGWSWNGSDDDMIVLRLK